MLLRREVSLRYKSPCSSVGSQGSSTGELGKGCQLLVENEIYTIEMNHRIPLSLSHDVPSSVDLKGLDLSTGS